MSAVVGFKFGRREYKLDYSCPYISPLALSGQIQYDKSMTVFVSFHKRWCATDIMEKKSDNFSEGEYMHFARIMRLIWRAMQATLTFQEQLVAIGLYWQSIWNPP